jgi:hypothetical protein
LIAKRSIGNTQMSYQLYLNTTGTLGFSVSSNGTTFAVDVTSTIAPTVSDGAALWVRATFDSDNGASGNDVKFYTSTDGITYTQLGSTVTTAGVATIFSGTSSLDIGSQAGGNSPIAAKIYRAQIFNGIAGTKVLDVDTSIISSGSAISFSALTGQTVTINRSNAGKKTSVVTAPLWLFGTDDYMDVADNALLDFDATESMTLLYIGRQWATPTSYGVLAEKFTSGSGRYGIGNLGTNFYPDVAISDGTNTVNPTISTPTWSAGTFFTTAMILDRSAQTLRYAVNGTLSTTASTTTVGSLASTSLLRINARPFGTQLYNDSEMFAVAIFRRALTATEITTLNNYYTARVG